MNLYDNFWWPETCWVIGAFTLAHVTASLNALATLLLVAAFLAIKQKNEKLHRNLVYIAFGVSSAFLLVYLTRYALEGNKAFPADDYPSVAKFYYLLLVSHVGLAITVPVLALISINHGRKNNRQAHRKIVKFAFPIWLYVSVTGVIVYFMLYWVYVPKIGEGS
ncbi:MAG: DUF420 domain-containing protein [Planctomycetota bacterium]|nr:DUF420 domain-containing protein [Planctomycetota bacterium]